MLYNIGFAISGLVFAIIIAVHFFSKPRLNNAHNNVFGVLTLVIIADNIFDILAAIAISYPESVPLVLNIAVNQLYYVAQMTLAPLLYLFVLSLTNLLVKKYRRRIIISFLPFIFYFVIWLGNPVTGYFFYFDNEFNYYRGPWMVSLYSLGGYFLILAIVMVILKRKNLRNNQLYSIAVFIVFSVVIVVFQFLIPTLLITGFATAVALTMTYLTLQNPVETIDDLTGAFNRTALSYHIQENENLDGIEHFVVISFDDYSGVVKNIGVERGNLLLSSVTEFMRTHSERSQIFRYANDVFVALFSNEKHLKDFVDDMERRMLFPWVLEKLEINISISLYYSDNIPAILKEDRLSLIIEQIIFKGKELGNRIVFPIDQDEINEILRMHNVEEAVRLALKQDKFDVYLQPIYCIKSDSFVSAEALIRLTDEKIGPIKLSDLIPIAEETGMILPIGRQVRNKVFRFVEENNLYEDKVIKRIMINLSALEVIRTDLVSDIDKCYKDYNVPYEFIGLEVTETNSSLGGNIFEKNMRELAGKGIAFALDDFGTGYANLDSVIALPFNLVKLDGTLVTYSEKNEKVFIVLAEHIQMFNRMGLKVIVEGVETKEQVSLLRDLPVDLIQGYYYAKPMPLVEAIKFMKEYNKGKKHNGENC